MGFTNVFWEPLASVRSKYEQRRNPSLDYNCVAVVKGKDSTFKFVKNMRKKARAYLKPKVSFVGTLNLSEDKWAAPVSTTLRPRVDVDLLRGFDCAKT